MQLVPKGWASSWFNLKQSSLMCHGHKFSIPNVKLAIANHAASKITKAQSSLLQSILGV